MNCLPVKANGELTSPFELVHGVKPDHQVLFRPFSTVHFKHDSDGSHDCDGVEAQSLQGIAIGRSYKSDGLLVCSPFTKQFHVTGSYKLDEGQSTANMFNLKCDGGIFIGPCDNGEAAQGTEPFPQGTGVTWKGVPGTVISVPQPSATCNLPESEASLSPCIVKLSNPNCGNNGIIEVSPVEMPHLTQPLSNSHSRGSVGLLPH